FVQSYPSFSSPFPYTTLFRSDFLGIPKYSIYLNVIFAFVGISFMSLLPIRMLMGKRLFVLLEWRRWVWGFAIQYIYAPIPVKLVFIWCRNMWRLGWRGIFPVSHNEINPNDNSH